MTRLDPALVAFCMMVMAAAAVQISELPPLPPMDIEAGPAEPILYQTKLAWDPQADASQFSLVICGQTNWTATNAIVFSVPEGTWLLELRAHSASGLASLPTLTNLVVSTATWLKVQPAACTNSGKLVPATWPTGEVSAATLPANVFVGYGVILTKRLETNMSLLP